MRGSTGALPSREAGSRVMGCVATPEPSLVGRRGPDLWPYPLSRLEAGTQVYLVYRVPTVALEPTL
jgi:hypothetical protein